MGDKCPNDKPYLISRLADVQRDVVSVRPFDSRAADGVASELRLLAVCAKCIAGETTGCSAKDYGDE